MFPSHDPEQDKDNENDNPPAAVSFARRTPIGDVVTNSLKNSITREATDKLLQDFGKGLKITGIESIAGVSTITFDREHGLSGIVTYPDPPSMTSNLIIDPPDMVTFAVAPSHVVVPSLNNLML